MKLFSRAVSSLLAVVPLAGPAPAIHAQASSSALRNGTWYGTAKVRDVDVPITIRLSGDGSHRQVAFLNGPARHADVSPASAVKLDGNHLVASFDYFARTLDATIDGDTLTGTFGATQPGKRPVPPTSFTAGRIADFSKAAGAAGAPNVAGSWEIATTSTKGEKAWELRIDPPHPKSPLIKAAIQRIDGDTGGLWGTWNGTAYTVTHFTAAGGAAYTITPQQDGTLMVKSLLGGVHGSSPDLVARRPEEARKLNLATPTDSAEQTTVKDPSVPLAFSFPDLQGKLVSNTDADFQGKVVIVAVGGSWCPNCHDEAPLLVDRYKRLHAKDLEVVNLDFEQGDADTDTPRLKAFIQHYGIPYPVLLAGTTDQLNEKIPQGQNLNCWPTAFFVGRDGLVKQTHAGFAGPGNTAGHIALQHEITSLVEQLLAQPAATHAAQLH